MLGSPNPNESVQACCHQSIWPLPQKPSYVSATSLSSSDAPLPLGRGASVVVCCRLRRRHLHLIMHHVHSELDAVTLLLGYLPHVNREQKWNNRKNRCEQYEKK